MFYISKTYARQLFYQDIVANSYGPLNKCPNQSAYGQKPYQFQYSVSTGVVSGYSKRRGSFSHKEERTLEQVTRPKIRIYLQINYILTKATLGSHQLTEPDRTTVVSYLVGPNTGFKV